MCRELIQVAIIIALLFYLVPHSNGYNVENYRGFTLARNNPYDPEYLYNVPYQSYYYYKK